MVSTWLARSQAAMALSSRPLVAITAASMIVYPLYAIAGTLIYYDVRIRKEGFDIEMMAGQAPLAAAPASAVSP
jgi:hypothetical protein